MTDMINSKRLRMMLKSSDEGVKYQNGWVVGLLLSSGILELTQWLESAIELYRPSDRRLSAKLVPTFADRGCHVVSVTNP
jgi:hypothetical protein